MGVKRAGITDNEHRANKLPNSNLDGQYAGSTFGAVKFTSWLASFYGTAAGLGTGSQMVPSRPPPAATHREPAAQPVGLYPTSRAQRSYQNTAHFDDGTSDDEGLSVSTGVIFREREEGGRRNGMRGEEGSLTTAFGDGWGRRVCCCC